MKENKLTQMQLAQEIGVSRQLIGFFLSGSSILSSLSLQAVHKLDKIITIPKKNIFQIGKKNALYFMFLFLAILSFIIHYSLPFFLNLVGFHQTIDYCIDGKARNGAYA